MDLTRPSATSVLDLYFHRVDTVKFWHTENTRLFFALPAVSAGVVVDKKSVCRSILDRGLEESLFVVVFACFCFSERGKKKHCISAELQFSFMLISQVCFFLIILVVFCMSREKNSWCVCVCVCAKWTCGKKPAKFLPSLLPTLLLSFLLCLHLALSASVSLNHWLTDHPTRNEGQFLPLQCCYCY